MELTFDSCVFINLFPLSKKVDQYCLMTGKQLEGLTGSDLANFVKADLKLQQIYLNILKGLKLGAFDVSILPTVYEECVDGPNKNKKNEFDAFLDKFNIKKEGFDKEEKFIRDYAQTAYLCSNNKKAVTVDFGGSKHPFNDSKILAESFASGRRLISADQHFSKTYLIYQRNCEIAHAFGMGEERAKIVPLQVTQFAKTRLYKSLNQKEK